MKVISVVGLKGGSGKTSTAVPVAWEAAREGRVVLLDVDPTLSATQWVRAAELEHERLRAETLNVDALEDRVNALEDSGDVEWVVIDTPPIAGDVVMRAAGVADLVVVPLHIGSGDLAQVAQTMGLLRLPMRANPDLRAVAVLNHARTMTRQTRETRAEVEAAGLLVAQTSIPFLETYVNAKGSRPNARWWHFRDLWTELRGLL